MLIGFPAVINTLPPKRTDSLTCLALFTSPLLKLEDRGALITSDAQWSILMALFREIDLNEEVDSGGAKASDISQDA